MFVRACGLEEPHDEHAYVQHWVKSELKYLHNPDSYPDKWDATYLCQGKETNAWNAEYLHENCAQCIQCADWAIERAMNHGLERETARVVVPVQHAEGVFAETAHQAKVSKL
jgi:hypothetical protein